VKVLPELRFSVALVKVFRVVDGQKQFLWDPNGDPTTQLGLIRGDFLSRPAGIMPPATLALTDLAMIRVGPQDRFQELLFNFTGECIVAGSEEEDSMREEAGDALKDGRLTGDLAYLLSGPLGVRLPDGSVDCKAGPAGRGEVDGRSVLGDRLESNLLVHEFGHVFNIVGHRDDPGAVMHSDVMNGGVELLWSEVLTMRRSAATKLEGR